eukprot:764412-Hanusia_phi.AAC.3
MLRTVAAFACVASAVSFSPSSLPVSSSPSIAKCARPSQKLALRMQSKEDQEITQAASQLKNTALSESFKAKEMNEGPSPVSTGGTQYVKADKVAPLFIIPQTSVVGDGQMVGDKGFDPLGLADSKAKLRIYREAELKHGRLAMLAALGWPVAELLNKPLAQMIGAKSLLVASPTGVVSGDELGVDALTRVPSLLNGGLDAVSPIYWASVLAFSAAVEFYATKIQKRAGFRATMAALGAEDITGIDIDGDGQVGAPVMLKDDNYLPGDLGFDPLNIYRGLDNQGKRDMQLKELNNGRLAMIAITGYAFNEAATKISVVQELGLPQ